MKKVFALLLCFIMIFSFVGCSNSNEETTSSTSSKNETSSTRDDYLTNEEAEQAALEELYEEVRIHKKYGLYRDATYYKVTSIKREDDTHCRVYGLYTIYMGDSMYNEYNEKNPVLFSGKFEFYVSKHPHYTKPDKIVIEANKVVMWQS